MKKKLLMMMLCVAMAVSAVGCSFDANDMVNDESPNNDDNKNGSDRDELQNIDTKEIYEAFLNGSERIYVDREQFSRYDIDRELTIYEFDNPDGYLIDEFLHQVVVNVNEYYFCNMESIAYSYIDLGKDGEPELLLSTAFFTEDENINRDYVIKYIDGKLTLCRQMKGEGYKNEVFVNDYGLTVETENYDDYYSCINNGYIGANGEYQFWYSKESYYEGYIVLDSRFETMKSNRDSYDLYIEIYQFEEDDGEEPFYKNYCYCAEIPDDVTTNGLSNSDNVAEAQALFDEAGVKLYTRDEINELIAQKQKEIGLSDEIASAEKSYGDYDWKYLSYDYEVVNGITDVYVTNIDEFMEAINNKATITLAPGTYNITDWLIDKVNSGEVRHLYEYDSECYTVADVGEHIFYYGWDDEPALVLRNINGLTIKSEFPDNPATIVSKPIYYDVLDFVEVNNTSLENIIIGHVEQTESACAGDVVNLTNCNNITFKGCDLYGCGATGLVLYSSYGVEMFDTVIHDCTFGAVRMNYADLMAYNCTFRNINGGTLFMMTNSYASYMCSTFEHMYGEFLYGDGYYNSLYYVDCSMDEDMMDWLTAMQDDGCDWIIIN